MIPDDEDTTSSMHRRAEREKWERHYAGEIITAQDPAGDALGAEVAARALEILPNGGTALEAGCGSGFQSLALARTGKFAVTLLDFSEQALRHARAVFANEGIAANFVQGDAFDAGAPDFDIVFNAGVLEHYTLDEQIALLKGMASRSRRYVLVLVPNRQCYWYWLWRITNSSHGDWPYGKEVPQVDMEEAFKGAGLHYLGQAFMGESWTESLINTTPGIDEATRQAILAVHRSALDIPNEQKSYLTGFLGAVTDAASNAVQGWAPTSRPESFQLAEAQAALADALSLCMAAQNTAVESKSVAAAREGEILAERDALYTRQSKLQAERDALRKDKAELKARQRELLAERERLQSELYTVIQTKAWRLTYRYWRTKWAIGRAVRGTARLPWRAAHGVYHAVIPLPMREKVWARMHTAAALRRDSAAARDPRTLAADRAQITAIINQYPDAKGVVVFPPSSDWDVGLFQRPQQMASAFASLGYVVLYWMPDPMSAEAKAQRFRKVAERLHVCVTSAAALEVIANPVVIAYTYNYEWASRLNAPTYVYEYIDHLEFFARVHPIGYLQHNHQSLLKESPVVVGTSTDLHRELLEVRADAMLCPNGVDFDFFAGSGNAEDELPDDMEDIVELGKPIIGYHGVLAEWFDYELVEYLADTMPDCEFVLIGPPGDTSLEKSHLKQHRNIHLLGQKAYLDLPPYVRAFDVAMIPFQLSTAINAVSPIKLFEYMAAGKPAVTSDMSECRKYSTVLIARTRDEWVASIREALRLREDAEYLAATRATALSNTWQARAADILRALAEKTESSTEVATAPESLAVAATAIHTK